VRVTSKYFPRNMAPDREMTIMAVQEPKEMIEGVSELCAHKTQVISNAGVVSALLVF
jgi:hypothetical protein